MHIAKLEIENIRSLKHFCIELPPKERAGWHVIIGSNASGKSTVIRSIALALIGMEEAGALRQNWEEWLRRGEKEGTIHIEVDPHSDDSFPQAEDKSELNAKISISEVYYGRKQKRQVVIGAFVAQIAQDGEETFRIYGQSLWSSKSLYFASSFGPYRRMEGSTRNTDKLFASSPKVAPHLSAFGEDIALSSGLEMIQRLHVKGLEKDEASAKLAKKIVEFVNKTDLLPFGAQIVRVASDRIVLRDGQGNDVDIEQMSSGYKSVLSTIFEIMHQMAFVFGEAALGRAIDVRKGTINLPGVVCIDEVDSHLHPTWQRDIGHWFTRRFPNVQFFVTTHSPIICRAATSVWKLPDPGNEESAGRVTGVALNRLIYGSIVDAYGTDLFGHDVARSDDGKKLADELALLNRKSIQGKLTRREAARMMELRATLPSESSETAPE
ncbi:AAA family ATPase [Azospirillum rugosum]|uniref:ATPase n=1 Tax=Azospirillum rugosum TaxID=416170 RepID=A0ABS4SRX0_9PROT|nr:ATP-binding protein [Azospirillum rugosum]MBP2295304.1 putative ATPase [Azospirillum rugosum]MDQ0528679.1 putative ATPase [Azospirillum rugosum]